MKKFFIEELHWIKNSILYFYDIHIIDSIYYIMSNPIVSFYKNDVSISSLLDARNTNDEKASTDTRFTYKGVDIREYFLIVGGGTKLTNNTGFSLNGIDIKENFRSLTTGIKQTFGIYNLETFISTGTFYLPIDTTVSVFMVAGGGGGGTNDRSGGAGGAGGVINRDITLGSGVYLTKGAYKIVIGNGGSGGGADTNGGPGGNTTAFGLIAIGGGYGSGANSINGGNGGSGGGGSHGSLGGQGTYLQGNNGLQGVNDTRGYFFGGGGGGGGSSPQDNAHGGWGVALNKNYAGLPASTCFLTGYPGINDIFAEGGGPGKQITATISEGSYYDTKGVSVTGKGGNGAILATTVEYYGRYIYLDAASTPAVANTGSGGGGGCRNPAGGTYPASVGGSGICIISYTSISNFICLNPVGYPITSNTYIVSGNADSYKNGTYVMSASSTYTTGSEPYRLFKTYDYDGWHSAFFGNNNYSRHPYYNGGSGSTYYYDGGSIPPSITYYYVTYIVRRDGNSGYDFPGEWVQIQLPYEAYLTSFTLYLVIDSNGNWSKWINRGFRKFVVAGSNNGTNWEEIFFIELTTDIVTNYSVKKEFDIPTENIVNKFSYFRLIVNQVFGVEKSGEVAMLGRWYLYGRTSL
jgi:hypothetical protein